MKGAPNYWGLGRTRSDMLDEERAWLTARPRVLVAHAQAAQASCLPRSRSLVAWAGLALLRETQTPAMSALRLCTGHSACTRTATGTPGGRCGQCAPHLALRRHVSRE